MKPETLAFCKKELQRIHKVIKAGSDKEINGLLPNGTAQLVNARHAHMIACRLLQELEKAIK